MLKTKIKRYLFNYYLILTIVSAGFTGFLIIEDILDEGGVIAETIIVDCNGNGDYSSIQDAVDNTKNGDTIRVWAGTYNERVRIFSSLSLIGNGSQDTIIDGCGDAIGFSIGADWINVTGFKIINCSSTGIRLTNVEKCTIENNNLSNLRLGIYLVESHSNLIKNNICNFNERYGIYIRDSNFNSLIKNTCEFNKDGIYLSRSISTTVYNNSMISCGISIYNRELSQLNTHDIKDNNINGRSFYYWVNVTNRIVPLNAGQVILVGCSNIIVEDQNCSNIATGIMIRYSDNITIKNNICSDGDYGISVSSSNDITISNNTCNSNSKYGIYLDECGSNTIINNTCNNNSGNGIILFISGNTTLRNNSIESCGLEFYTDGSIQSWDSISIDETNTINGKPIYYWRNKHNAIVPNNAGEVILVNCSNIIVEGQDLSNGGGINVIFSNNITIQNNLCINSSNGIDISNSENINIINNTCSGSNDEYNGLIFVYMCNKIDIQNNTCNNSGYSGIYIGQSDFNYIINNICNNNWYGVVIFRSNKNHIQNNTCNNNSFYGIGIDSSDWNIITNNTSDFNFYAGIDITSSESNIISNNNLQYNNLSGIRISQSRPLTIKNTTLISCGFDIKTNYDGFSLDYLESWVIDNNTINGKPLYCWVNVHNATVPSDAGQVILINCSNIIIEDQNCSDVDIGIMMSFCNNVEIRNNICNSNKYGIEIIDSSSNKIYNNTCSYNSIGIRLSSSILNEIYNNNFSDNEYGIQIYSNTNRIFRNIISNNSDCGIEFGNDHKENIVFHNLFITNNEQVREGYRSYNYFHSYGEGNYWSDYEGSDNGGNRRIANDHIGDTLIPHLEVDEYPYTIPYGWELPRNQTSKVSNEDEPEYYSDNDENDKNISDLIVDNLWPWGVIGIILILMIIFLLIKKKNKKK